MIGKELGVLSKVEACIQWAMQHGYCFAKDAAMEYGDAYSREFHEEDSTYCLWSFRDMEEPEPDHDPENIYNLPSIRQSIEEDRK